MTDESRPQSRVETMTDEELDSAAGGLAGASKKTPDTGSKLGAAPGIPGKKVANSGGDGGI